MDRFSASFVSASTSTSPVPHRSFWQRRVRDPLVALLTQGATPEKLAAGFAWGTVCSLFPFLGLTTLLNALVGYWQKLNQPLLQALNYALTPIHLVMILAYVRLGEWLWFADDERFSVADMVSSFHRLGFGEFLRKFSFAGLHAFTAWALTAPLIYAAVYFCARPALRRLAHLLPGVKPA